MLFIHEISNQIIVGHFQIRNVGMTIVVFSSNLTLFGFLKILPFLLDENSSIYIDVHGTMIMFAILSIVGIIFVATVLNETNGQSLDDVGRDQKTKIVDTVP